MDEELNAALYREKCARGRRYRAAQLSALAGNPAAARAVCEAWAPLYEEVKGTEPAGPARFPEDECGGPPGRAPRILHFA